MLWRSCIATCALSCVCPLLRVPSLAVGGRWGPPNLPVHMKKHRRAATAFSQTVLYTSHLCPLLRVPSVAVGGRGGAPQPPCAHEEVLCAHEAGQVARGTPRRRAGTDNRVVCMDKTVVWIDNRVVAIKLPCAPRHGCQLNHSQLYCMYFFLLLFAPRQE